jgi:hypothetical protein
LKSTKRIFRKMKKRSSSTKKKRSLKSPKKLTNLKIRNKRKELRKMNPISPTRKYWLKLRNY